MQVYYGCGYVYTGKQCPVAWHIHTRVPMDNEGRSFQQNSDSSLPSGFYIIILR
jgi:hypothetical protein